MKTITRLREYKTVRAVAGFKSIALTLCVLLYAFGVALAASAQDQDSASNHSLEVDRYKEFWSRGVLDAAVSNQTANEIVLAGITSDDPEIIDSTIKAINYHDIARTDNRPNPYGPTPARTFQEVPGLKEFLIEYWMQQYEQSGYNQDLEARGMVLPEGGVTNKYGDIDDISMKEAQAIAYEIKDRLTGWPMIPGILCSLWPGDADVLQLVWYQQETEVHPEQHVGTLGLLNLGKFATPEADAFRISNLTLPYEADSMAHIAVGNAAEGLTMNRPIDALSPLLAAGSEHPSAREQVWVALASYDDEQLAPYAEDIRLLLVSCHELNVGYRRSSLTRASFAVNCQLTVASN